MPLNGNINKQIRESAKARTPLLEGWRTFGKEAKGVRHRFSMGRAFRIRGTMGTCQYALIDYRNGNEVLKWSVMTYEEQKAKNEVLSGTGMAWSRVNKPKKIRI